jgi:hypothetical protein
MHLFGRANNGIYRARLNALGAADTLGFTDIRHGIFTGCFPI